MKIVMFSAENFPPKKMNANHNRLYYLAKSIGKKHEVLVLCPNNCFKYETINLDGIKIIKFPSINLRFINKLFVTLTSHIFVKKILKKEKWTPNIMWYNSVHCVILSRKIKTTKVYDVMGLIQLESTKKDSGIVAKLKRTYYKIIEDKVLSRADYITTVNNAHKKEIQKIVKKEVFVIRDGFNKVFLKKYPKKNTEKIIVTFVGSFFKDRLAGIIDEIPLIIKNNNNIFFEIIGDGKYLQIYKDKMKQNNCEKNVTFTGHLENSRVCINLQKSDICFSDDWSYIGWPTKVSEYMAMSKASLVEDTPAVREIITPNKNGLLYSSPKDFSKKLMLLVKNVELRKRLGKQAHIDSQKYTWDKCCKEFQKIMETINEKI